MEKEICIVCAKCQKPVDKTIVTHFTHGRSYSIKVFCHGASEEMKLEEDAVDKKFIQAVTESKGLAFVGAEEKPMCAVRGPLHGGRAICGSVINAERCGSEGSCEHQNPPRNSVAEHQYAEAKERAVFGAAMRAQLLFEGFREGFTIDSMMERDPRTGRYCRTRIIGAWEGWAMFAKAAGGAP